MPSWLVFCCGEFLSFAANTLSVPDAPSPHRPHSCLPWYDTPRTPTHSSLSASMPSAETVEVNPCPWQQILCPSTMPHHLTACIVASPTTPWLHYPPDPPGYIIPPHTYPFIFISTHAFLASFLLWWVPVLCSKYFIRPRCPYRLTSCIVASPEPSGYILPPPIPTHSSSSAPMPSWLVFCCGESLSFAANTLSVHDAPTTSPPA